MDKKKLTSWGVSFSSLALVAGMMGYLGITNKNATNKSNTTVQTQVTSQNTTQGQQSGNNQNSSFTFTGPNQTTNNNGTQQTTNQSHQHGGFDTTTGGS